MFVSFFRLFSLIVVVQSLSCVWLFLTPWTAAHQASQFVIVSQDLLKYMSIESVILSNHFILCHPLLLLPSVFPSIRVFFSESSLRIRWPKSWSFASVLPVNIQDWYSLELTGLISLQSRGLSRVFSSTTFRKHQFFGYYWNNVFWLFRKKLIKMNVKYQLLMIRVIWSLSKKSCLNSIQICLKFQMWRWYCREPFVYFLKSSFLWLFNHTVRIFY